MDIHIYKCSSQNAQLRLAVTFQGNQLCHFHFYLPLGGGQLLKERICS